MLAAGPHEPCRRLLQLGVVPRGLQVLGWIAAAERSLVRSRTDVAGQHARVGVVEDRRLDAAAEQLVGLAHEELVEPVFARDEHGDAAAATARAPPLLAERRDGAREPDADHGVEETD